jgi:acyl-coenzyme A thioesterase PaaI-like protein
MPAATISGAKLERLLAAEFPEMFNDDGGFVIEMVRHGACRVRQVYRRNTLRPGGTISGATMMALADFAMYVAVLASIGWVPLAVTTNLNINFLRKPAPRDLAATISLPTPPPLIRVRLRDARY